MSRSGSKAGDTLANAESPRLLTNINILNNGMESTLIFILNYFAYAVMAKPSSEQVALIGLAYSAVRVIFWLAYNIRQDLRAMGMLPTFAISGTLVYLNVTMLLGI